MPKTVLGVRIDIDDLTELKKRATKENMTPSASKLIKESLSGMYSNRGHAFYNTGF